MSISGTITIAEPVDSTDQMSNKYQWITIDGPNGPIRGRIGSKQGYQANTPINVTVESKQGQEGQYNYFKRYNPQYDQPSQPPPQKPQQGAPVASQSTNGSEMVRIRSMALSYAKDLVCNGKLELELLESRANEFTAYIMTGKWLPDEPMSDLPF